jgi:2-keto-4-pentenoate hydratase/2-oxohepta-3-ene-1,7-dioic acid hydratase in catechol pathway
VKFVRYQGNSGPQYGVVEDDGTVRELSGCPFGDYSIGASAGTIDQLSLLAPVDPPRVIGVGSNYIAHIEEMGLPTPPFPMLFLLPPTTVIGPGDSIVYPREGERVEFEGELVIVIGKPARRVSEAEALDYVLGYTIGNDVSERVIQFAEMKMGAIMIGKSFDTFKPLGPIIATDIDPSNVDLTTRVNGEVRQDANTSDLLFPAAKLVSYMSEAMTLLPGDVIYSGTPAGVGQIAPGDTIDIEIQGIGTLSNSVVAED